MKSIKIKNLIFSILVLVGIKLLFYLIDVNWFNKFHEFIELKREFNLETSLFLKEKSLLEIIIGVLIFIPIFEELLFRSWLILNNRSVALFISSIPILIFKIFNPNIEWFYSLLLCILIGICFYGLSSILLKRFKLKKNTSKHYIYLSVLSSSLIFGGFHLFNYTIINIYVVALIIPHILSGLVYACLRIKNGITWSILLHIINNSPVILVYILHNF